MNTHSFSRVETLLGTENFQKLTQAHITIVGYGAVGSFAAEAIARSGVGHIRIIDADTYEMTNINRQLGASTQTIDQPKVNIGQKRLLDIHPNLDLECLEQFIDASNCHLVDAPFADGIRPITIIDAIDTLDAKISLLSYCHQHNIQVLSSMGAARRTHPECIRFADISKTEVCPLARDVRKGLRKLGIEHGIGCVYSIEPAMPQTHAQNPTDNNRRITRPALGSLITVTGAFGLRLASACLDIICATD